jgi:hypothetical protein
MVSEANDMILTVAQRSLNCSGPANTYFYNSGHLKTWNVFVPRTACHLRADAGGQLMELYGWCKQSSM